MKPRKSTRIFHNSSTMRENNTLDLVDRISDLPDSILGLILSKLPTKNAVATSILSKRWKLVWTNVHNLDFCLTNWMKTLPEDIDMKFVGFVNRVLLLLDGEFLKRFSLVWAPRFIPSQVSTWIDNVISRNVHRFFVCVWSFHTNYEAFEIPISLFRCDSLQYLELIGSINVSSAVVICLPRLESLKLGSVYFQSEEAFEKLISGCPMLNYLRLSVDVNKMVTYSKVPSSIFKDFTYIISSTSLRHLEFDVKFSNFWYTPSLKLKASSLEYLKLAGFIPQISVQGTLSSLVEAYFAVRYCHNPLSEDTYNSVVEVVRALDCAKALTLSFEAMWAISNATICLSTKFKRLTKLKAEAVSCYCSALQDFIQISDKLEVLSIKQVATNLEELVENHFDSKWIVPVEVPRCLLNSLKEVSFYGYAGLDDERDMIGYMLKHGNALEVMQVTWHTHTGKWKELELAKEIHNFPRKSRACKLQFLSSEHR